MRYWHFLNSLGLILYYYFMVCKVALNGPEKLNSKPRCIQANRLDATQR